MRRPRRYVAPMRALGPALAGLLLAAPALSFAQDAPFEPTGEVRFRGSGAFATGASFDASRVVGPSVNLTRRDDGTWAGDLAGHDLDLRLQKDRLTGPNVNITFRTGGGKTKVEGLFFGRRVRVEIDGKRLTGRFGSCSVDLVRRGVQHFHGDVGCAPQAGSMGTSGKGSMTLYGEAAEESPPMPQFALAIVAIMP